MTLKGLEMNKPFFTPIPTAASQVANAEITGQPEKETPSFVPPRLTKEGKVNAITEGGFGGSLDFP
jgi:hypothetical protein